MPDFVRRVPDGDSRERLICAESRVNRLRRSQVRLGRGDRCPWRGAGPVRDQLTRGGRTADGETLEEGAARAARQEPRTDITVYGILGASAGIPLTTGAAFEWLAPSPARSSP